MSTVLRLRPHLKRRVRAQVGCVCKCLALWRVLLINERRKECRRKNLARKVCVCVCVRARTRARAWVGGGVQVTADRMFVLKFSANRG